MKLNIPAILTAALIVASPAAFAQNTNYTGSTSKPGASFQKDDTTTSVTKTSKKHMASSKKKQHAKHTSSKAQTTGSGSSSTDAGVNKDETKPKSQ